MNDIDIIRGLLAGLPECHYSYCSNLATRRTTPYRDYVCDKCAGDSAHIADLPNADAIRAAVRRVAESEATPSGERVVWSDSHVGVGMRLVVGAGCLRYEERLEGAPWAMGRWTNEGMSRMPRDACVFLGRAALAHVGAADTEPAPAPIATKPESAEYEGPVIIDLAEVLRREGQS